MIVILYDVENMQRIVLCKMYLKYLMVVATPGRIIRFLNKMYVISH